MTTQQSTATGVAAPAAVAPAVAKQGLWICKWVDYSNKYGLGYQLSDDSVGVLFNDATKIILAPDQKHIESVDRESNGGAVTTMTLSDFPVALDKKITLLKYFRNYMTEHLLNGADTHDQGSKTAASAAPHMPGLAFVRKWLRTKHAIVFRMSNSVIQINFFDHTKLIVNTPLGLVTFINKDRISTTYYLDDVAKSRHVAVEELVSRLSYATDVVEHLMKSGSRH